MNDRSSRSRPARSGRTSINTGGKKISLTDLPLMAFTLSCGHEGTDHGIAVGDPLFCLECADHRYVAIAETITQKS